MHCLNSLRWFFIKSLTVQQAKRHTINSSFVRCGGNFQRSRFTPLLQKQMQTLREDFLEKCNDMTSEKWHDIREDIVKNYKNINHHNIDATILGLCNDSDYLPLAKDYVAYLQSNGKTPNIATLGRLLRVYNAAYQRRGRLTREEENEVIEICDKIQGNHDVLDAITCEHLIHGLVSTEHQWKKALHLLEMLKLTASPGISVYIQLITKAFLYRDFELGWRLLDEMVEQGKVPKCEIYMTLIDVISEDPDTFPIHFQKLLKFLESHELLLSEKVAVHLEERSKNTKLKFQAKITKTNSFGKCFNCKQNLKSVAISDQDYDKLRDSFLQKVLIRKDAFQKSSPEEIDNFKRFVDETAPYDCVIDGLNVAYSKGSKRSTQELANLLVSVVRYFKSQQKSVLVLGRKHMNKWPKASMKYIREHANVYLTNNLTQDDPFMLYATLKSGQSTDFFSRDLMRSHAYLLGSDLKSIFRRWQQEHQFSLITQTCTGKILIKEPFRYLIGAHEVNNTWHLPLALEYTSHMPETFEIPESWLCLKLETIV